jgi:hypothetical protein
MRTVLLLNRQHVSSLAVSLRTRAGVRERERARAHELLRNGPKRGSEEVSARRWHFSAAHYCRPAASAKPRLGQLAQDYRTRLPCTMIGLKFNGGT